MSRFRIDHPSHTDIHAEAGVDHAVGPFFIDLYAEGRDRPFKTLDFFTAGKPVTLQDCFELLIEHQFFTRDQLEAALVYLQDGGANPRNVRVVEVIVRFKAAE